MLENGKAKVGVRGQGAEQGGPGFGVFYLRQVAWPSWISTPAALGEETRMLPRLLLIPASGS